MGKKSLRLSPVRAALAGLALAALPMASFAFVSVGVSINFAPPALPVYVQPPCPAVGYIWTPGYWAYEDDDYYWVPGTWVLAPSPGLLWTPGYWGWADSGYIWHAGYWGPHVGFYGGINYGYGYTGVGFEGGYWRGRSFYYNRAVSNLGGIHVTNVYNRTVVNNVTVVNRVSYNGGQGGLRARPSGHELAAERERHVEFTPAQREHEHAAFGNRDLRASVNGGKPRIAATERPGVFSGRGVVAARAAGAPYRGGGEHGGPARGAEARADRPGAAGGAAIRGGTGGGPGAGVRGTDVHSEARGPGVRNDRPPGAGGASAREFHSGGPGGGSTAIRGGAGGGPGAGGLGAGGVGHAADVRTPAAGGERGPAAMRNDRPPSAGGAGGREFHSGGPGGGSTAIRGGAGGGPEARSAGAGPAMRGNVSGGGPQPHVNQMNQMRMERSAPEGARPGGGAPPMNRQFGGGGGQPMPRAQAAPRPPIAPQPQSAPRPENFRGGGGEPPRVQAQSQNRGQPQGRGVPQDHPRDRR